MLFVGFTCLHLFEEVSLSILSGNNHCFLIFCLTVAIRILLCFLGCIFNNIRAEVVNFVALWTLDNWRGSF